MSMTIEELYGAMLIDPVKEVCGDKSSFYIGLAMGIFKDLPLFRGVIESANNPYLITVDSDDEKFISCHDFKVKVYDCYKDGIKECFDRDPLSPKNQPNPSLPTIVIANHKTLTAFDTGVSYEGLQRIIDKYELKRFDI